MSKAPEAIRPVDAGPPKTETYHVTLQASVEVVVSVQAVTEDEAIELATDSVSLVDYCNDSVGAETSSGDVVRMSGGGFGYFEHLETSIQ